MIRNTPMVHALCDPWELFFALHQFIEGILTVSQNARGKYFANILFEYEEDVTEKELENFISLDFSMHKLYVDSDGNCPQFPRYYRLCEKKLKREHGSSEIYDKNIIYKKHTLK